MLFILIEGWFMSQSQIKRLSCSRKEESERERRERESNKYECPETQKDFRLQIIRSRVQNPHQTGIVFRVRQIFPHYFKVCFFFFFFLIIFYGNTIFLNDIGEHKLHDLFRVILEQMINKLIYLIRFIYIHFICIKCIIPI